MEKFEDDAFAVEATQEAGCQLALKVTVKPDRTKKCHKQGVKKVNKQISIPGFRKGKAPDQTVISKYGSYVDSEWKEIVLHEALDAGFQLTKKYPLTKESLKQPKLESCSLEEGAVVTFSYEHYPNVPEIDFSQISLPAIEKAEVKQERIDEVVEQICKSNADFEPIEDRAVKEGDYVDLTIDAIDREPEMNIVKERRFPVEKELMGDWMRKLVVGKKVGDKVEGKSVNEKDEKDFKETLVRIEIHSIWKIVMPEVDDELAKKVGTKSKDDLLARIKENLEQEAEQEQKGKQIEALDDALVQQFQFDLPTSIVEGERRHRIADKLRLLKMQDLSDEEIKQKEAEVEKEVADGVEDSLRLYFINKQIEKQGKISLTNQELNQELAHQVATNPAYRADDMDKDKSRALIERLSTTLLQRKTKDYALEQVLQA
ncbi:MAG: Trigger factor [Chlamydiales bacterium]|nr:Trigger factor [Chlamydiales bacterium]MCH9635050.1 Trigger factor [Chlamydiales bacterium]